MDHQLSADRNGFLEAFCAMERRRLRRIQNGRVVKDGLGRHVNSAMKAIIVVMILAELFNITMQRFGVQQYWIIPVVITLALLFPAITQTIYYPEHTFTLWVGTELYIFCLWFAWFFDVRRKEDRAVEKMKMTCMDLPHSNWLSSDKFCLDEPQILSLILFVVVLIITVLLFIPHRVLLPCALRLHCCGDRWLVWWRSVRKAQGGSAKNLHHYTYKPSGLFGWHREEFMYVGEVDEKERPHGEGVWWDTSFHGECLRGEWFEGMPAGSWTSREYGTGAQFMQCAVGYVTSRGDCQQNALNKSSFLPHKESQLRYGIGYVEASFAGGFFPFLPSVEYHNEMDSVEDMVGRLVQSYHKRQAAEDPQLRVEVIPQESEASLFSGVKMTQVFVSFPEGENVGYIAESAVVERLRTPMRNSLEALVFIHGFNCDLATAMGRIAQTFSLGNMAPHIVPFVFSYSGGTELSYFQAKAHFKDYGSELAEFLRSLRGHFSEVHILTHSCGAEFLFTNWSSIAECFMPSRRKRPDVASSRGAAENNNSTKRPRWIPKHSRHFGTQDDLSLHMATLTMLNPDVELDTVKRLLPDIMHSAEHFTAYNDSNDGALFWSGVVRRLSNGLSCKGFHRRKLLGTAVQPLFLEDQDVRTILHSGSSRGMRRRHTLDGVSATRPTRSRVLSGLGHQLSQMLHPPRVQGDGTIEIIDCSNIEQNVHALRHNYFMLNTQMVEDVCELIGRRQKAQHRVRLCQHSNGNVYSFLSPPAFLKSN